MAIRGNLKHLTQHQVDADINQANPVSTTLYEVLPTTFNVKVISIAALVAWIVTQPNPLEILVTIDGITRVYTQANPANLTWYYPYIIANDTELLQLMNRCPRRIFSLYFSV